MAPRVQAHDIIAKRNMWIIPDTLLRAQESAMTKVHVHMSHHHGKTRSAFDMHRLMIAIDLYLRVIAIAIVQLLRAFDMHRPMIAIAIVQLIRVFDMHRPMIATAIVQLMIVINTNMKMNQDPRW